MSNQKPTVFKLSSAIGMIFTMKSSDIAKVTGMNYNTLISYKYRWKRNKLSIKRQEEIVLDFGFVRIDEYRYTFPSLSIKSAVDKKLAKKEKADKIKNN